MQTRPPLRRPPQGRWVAGVAAGIALHTGLPVGVVRLLFALATLAAGAGVVAYLFWWVTVPSGDPATAAADARPPVLVRLARAPGERAARAVAERRFSVTDVGTGLALLAAATALAVARLRLDGVPRWLAPALLALAGAALVWSQLEDSRVRRASDRAAGTTPTRRLAAGLRIAGGLVLAGAGMLLLVSEGAAPGDVVLAGVAALTVVVGIGLVLAPWGLRLVRELADERAARARESERADIAAHLHDSVLQTLALIRARAEDPVEVARMARAQERELRSWLYDDRPAPGTSLAAELRAVVAEIEDTRTGPGGEAVTVDVVVVGDRVPDPDSDALLQATREALVNAVRHGRPPVSVYLEATADATEVFVRDRGDGFDPEDVPPDRFGVRESILGRVRRRGGTATVTCGPRGTEVHLAVTGPAGEEAR